MFLFRLKVGKSVISRDCSKRYTCNGPQEKVKVEELKKCSQFAHCKGNENQIPTCYCNRGYKGDGYNCKKGNPFVFKLDSFQKIFM